MIAREPPTADTANDFQYGVQAFERYANAEE